MGLLFSTLNKIQTTLSVPISKIIFEKLPSNFSKFHFFDYKDVLNKLLYTIQNEDVIMIKGSNSTKLHLVSAELRRSI